MGQVLDYEPRPKSRGPFFSSLSWAILISLFEHLLVFGLYAAALDGGRLASMCAAVSLGYWAVVVLIAIRRHRHPTKADLAFVAFGYPIMLFPSIYIATGGL